MFIGSFLIASGVVCGVGLPILAWRAGTNYLETRARIQQEHAKDLARAQQARLNALQPVEVTAHCRYYFVAGMYYLYFAHTYGYLREGPGPDTPPPCEPQPKPAWELHLAACDRDIHSSACTQARAIARAAGPPKKPQHPPGQEVSP
jgi:hypothetical protein